MNSLTSFNPFTAIMIEISLSIFSLYLINCSDMNKLLVPDMDDYERSIRSYLLYGGSIRFNHLAPKTKFKKNTGGAQDSDRENRLSQSKEIMLNTYPELLYLKKRKTDTNPILKDLRKSVKKN